MANFNKNVIEIAGACGATLLKYILVVERNPVDAGYTKKKQEGALIPSQPFYRYSIKPIRVNAIAVRESSNEVPSVIFNKEEDGLRLPLANVETLEAVIPKPSTDTVRKAIAEFESTGKRVIFTDYIGLWREVNALNEETKVMMDTFINEQMKLSSSLEDSNQMELAACKAAMKECGIDTTGILP